MTTQNISDRIAALHDEAVEHRDIELAELCDRARAFELLDSDTRETVPIYEVDPSEGPDDVVGYVYTIIESLDSDQAEGHVRYHGRHCYAG